MSNDHIKGVLANPLRIQIAYNPHGQAHVDCQWSNIMENKYLKMDELTSKFCIGDFVKLPYNSFTDSIFKIYDIKFRNTGFYYDLMLNNEIITDIPELAIILYDNIFQLTLPKEDLQEVIHALVYYEKNNFNGHPRNHKLIVELEKVLNPLTVVPVLEEEVKPWVYGENFRADKGEI
jgi:hypothetical protein